MSADLPMTIKELCTKVREAAERAESGPWQQFDDGGEITAVHKYGIEYADCVWGPHGPGYGVLADCSPAGQPSSERTTANAHYIATVNPSVALALLGRIEELEKALGPFADAYRKHDDPGVSDLYDEQPVAWHVALGAYRAARRLTR